VVERNLEYLKNISLNEIKGFGEKRISSFKKYGINSISDLIRFFPKKHIDRSQVSKIKSINSEIKKEITVLGEVKDVSVFTTKTRLRIATLIINDETGSIRAKWFGPQYIETRFKTGDSVALSGIPDVKKTGSIEFKNPTIEKFSDPEELNETGSLIPIYPKIDGLSSSIIRKGIKESLRRIPEFEDFLHKDDIVSYKIVNRTKSYNDIHFPEKLSDYENARNRLAFDEFLYLQAIFKEHKISYNKTQSGIKYKLKKDTLTNFEQKIPFKLTKSQKDVINEIFSDMNEESPMKRLLQGDVGSGKTIVAAAAIYATILSSYQAVLMAPTEVLAEQHYNSLSKILLFDDFKVHLLTSSVKERKEIMNTINSGDPAFIIGTHALIQENIKFNNLGLAIIDEQQRFGVQQRKKLTTDLKTTPDQLVMTATPIPRTTALAIYGDLDLSVIDELPPGRKPVKSFLYEGYKEDNEKIYKLCEEHIKNNSQVFVVCPFIEESETLDIKAAENVYKAYKKELPEYSIEILHGKMTSEEKEAVMRSMHKNETQILISTVVIEVGIDIPNATLMIIESAERFGLNQLHQLRGRVGRGEKESECVFHITEGKDLETITDEGKKRLLAIVDNLDGFKLAEIDLQIRGEGKVTGTSQSGISDLKIADLRYDYEILEKSKEYFENISDQIGKAVSNEAKILFPNFEDVEDTT
jgi:ATP-dependent DNA helicase RecG|tara:strand:+ start:1470 stop:3560 length:2091 start_codon:yes stop_codon:yes gene_type:complete